MTKASNSRLETCRMERVRNLHERERFDNPLLEAAASWARALWLDDIGRAMLDEGYLARLIEADGIAGVTSNPAIFAASINKEPQYQRAIAELLPKETSNIALYETLTIEGGGGGTCAAPRRPVPQAVRQHPWR